MAAPELTAIDPDTLVIEGVTVSVAVIVWLPAVFNVAEKVPTPFVRVELAGSVAAPSLLVKCAVPGVRHSRVIECVARGDGQVERISCGGGGRR